jgi:DNA polymerase (family 10)
VAAEVARGEDVKDAIGVGGDAVTIRYADGTRLDLYCVAPDEFEYALWRATGSEAHIRQVEAATSGGSASLPRVSAFEALATSARIAPELREGLGEVEAAELPDLITLSDIRGVLHCHSQYSDGSTTIAEMAAAARERGWWYLGISDHSQSAAYAGGLSPDAVKRQHEEIDRLQERFHGFRILKGIEADILADGRVDYDESLLETFDYVIASVHSRFAMDERAMTERVLRALENPFVTILGHPTGRLLLTREPYAIDMPAVLARAGGLGAAVELNADPHRLDLDWTLCRVAKELGCLIEIGPDAHSVAGLDNMTYGINTARKGWLEAGDVLNTQHAHDIVERARSRRVTR